MLITAKRLPAFTCSSKSQLYFDHSVGNVVGEIENQLSSGRFKERLQLQFITRYHISKCSCSELLPRNGVTDFRVVIFLLISQQTTVKKTFWSGNNVEINTVQGSR